MQPRILGTGGLQSTCWTPSPALLLLPPPDHRRSRHYCRFRTRHYRCFTPSLMHTDHFRRLLLPGLVFQSVVIAGGYGTGREIVEFFLSLGPRAGLLAMGVSTLIWSFVCAVSFEFARQNRATDYRSFFKALIGRFAWVYEVCWFAMMLIVLAVIAAAAGEIVRDVFGATYLTGVVGVSVLIGALLYWGTEGIEKVLSAWTIVLYGVFVLVFVRAIGAFGPEISAGLWAGGGVSGPGALEAAAAESSGAGFWSWCVSGVAYAGYNVALIPALLFSIRHVTSTRDAVMAGLLAGPIAMIPAFLFFIAMVGQYPEIVPAAVPAITLLEGIGAGWLLILFHVMLLGTLVETGTGLIHSVNERIHATLLWRGAALRGTGRPDPTRPPGLTPQTRLWMGVAWLTAGAFVAQFGLISLIARGYGTLTWLFVAVYVLPVATIGLWRIWGGRIWRWRTLNTTD